MRAKGFKAAAGVSWQEMFKLGSGVFSPDSGGQVLAISGAVGREEGLPLGTAGCVNVLRGAGSLVRNQPAQCVCSSVSD